jgi:AAA+ superfamily predicted ATPase
MWREILGLEKKQSNLTELIVPRRGFADVVLPEETRQQLYEALTQIEKHRLIFSQWGLGERHPTGLGLAFNFAGPPGTGKTICAEAVAFTLGRKLLRIRYAELESCWAGETGKNIRAIFREAKAQDAVLFFDEADSVAARRFTNIQIGYEREANQSVNILLKELEEHEGVVIFATNLASNFDPAFERRIRTHILFRMPSVPERERIWHIQVHPDKTPLAADVDFRELAERFEVPGGDIRNAVLKAAQIAAAEEGPDDTKRIQQRHFVQAMEQVIGAKRVMQQNAVDGTSPLFPWQEAVDAAEKRMEALDADVHACRTELGLLADGQTELGESLRQQLRLVDAKLERGEETDRHVREELEAVRGVAEGLREQLERAAETQETALQRWHGEQQVAVEELAVRLQAQEARLEKATLLPWPRAVTAAGASILALLLVALGVLGGRLWW